MAKVIYVSAVVPAPRASMADENERYGELIRGAEFAARPGVEPLVVPGNHMAMLTRPAEVADALVSVL